MYFLPAERLRLYRNFKSIEVNDFHGMIHFYEQHEDGIRALDFYQYLDCTLAYTNALFDSANHRKHLVMVDHLLELVIMQNVEEWDGEDLYHQLLFNKSASFYHLEEYAKSERILREIINIYPDDRLAAVYLNKVLLHQRPRWVYRSRTATIVLFLAAIVLIALELFAAPKFFPEWLQPMRIAHNLLIALSVASLSLGEAGHTVRSWFETRRFVRQAVRKKNASFKF
jgi:tetratricopeptide (TPR) repeat protein